MSKDKSTHFSNNIETDSVQDNSKELFKRGISKQLELFKSGSCGDGIDLDLQCDAIENIKSDIKFLLEGSNEDDLKKIEGIIKEYREKETTYRKNSPQGIIVKYPENIENIFNEKLRKAYELIVKNLHRQNLLM